MMKRFFKILFIGIAVIFVVLISFITIGISSRRTTVVNKQLALTNRLAIPPLLAPRFENGKKVFDLRAQVGKQEVFTGLQTTTWGYNGNYLGPTIRIHTGDTIQVNVTNNLSETTTVHWHGMHLPAVMDGGPHQPIKHNTTWSPHWSITNQASTLWYHPHTLEQTGKQVYMGLAGLVIIDDDNSDTLSLPRQYGVDDIPLVVQDRKFDKAGQLVYDHNHARPLTAGMLGDTILVNGTVGPYLDVPAKMVRFRILNGSNARRYNFGFSDNRTFHQIGTDGGLLESPVATNRVLLGPGERAEIVVDLSTTENPITLMSYAVPGDDNKIRGFVLKTIVGETDEFQEFKILELRPQQGAYAKETLPQKLNSIKGFAETGAVKRRFSLDSFTIDGKKMDHARVDDVVKKGDVEIWQVYNNSPVYHVFHVHGVQFLVLDRDGEKTAASEAGWKDSVVVNPGKNVRLIMQFTEYSDPHFPYMFHCHILEHEDMGMMGQFVVVDDLSQKVEIRTPLINSPMQMEDH